MFELYYCRPQDLAREMKLAEQIMALEGRFDFREESEILGVCNHVCLTYAFDGWPQAVRAAAILRGQGEQVEGPQEYGD